MGQQHGSGPVRVTVEQIENWRAAIEGGPEIVAASLAELRRTVVRELSARRIRPAGLVEIEWVYLLAHGEVRVEKQRVDLADPGPRSETSSRVGWNQPRVDSYLSRRRRSRRLNAASEPES